MALSTITSLLSNKKEANKQTTTSSLSSSNTNKTTQYKEGRGAISIHSWKKWDSLVIYYIYNSYNLKKKQSEQKIFTGQPTHFDSLTQICFEFYLTPFFVTYTRKLITLDK